MFPSSEEFSIKNTEMNVESLRIDYKEEKFSSREGAFRYLDLLAESGQGPLDRELFKVSVLRIDRYSFQGILKVDVVLLGKKDFYLVGCISPDKLASVPPEISKSFFGPVQSKIIEYIARYYPKLLVALGIPDIPDIDTCSIATHWRSHPLSKIVDMDPGQEKQVEEWLQKLCMDFQYMYDVARENKTSLYEATKLAWRMEIENFGEPQ